MPLTARLLLHYAECYLFHKSQTCVFNEVTRYNLNISRMLNSINNAKANGCNIEKRFKNVENFFKSIVHCSTSTTQTHVTSKTFKRRCKLFFKCVVHCSTSTPTFRRRLSRQRRRWRRSSSRPSQSATLIRSTSTGQIALHSYGVLYIKRSHWPDNFPIQQ